MGGVIHSRSSNETVGVRARVDIAPGTRLSLRYGDLCNEELLFGFGFVLYHNPFDRLVVPPRALAYALQASVEGFQRALALNDTQDFLSAADAKTLASKQVSRPQLLPPRFTLQTTARVHTTPCT